MTADPAASDTVGDAFALAATLSAVISPLKREMPRTSLTACAVVPWAYALDDRAPVLAADPRYSDDEPLGPDEEARARFREFARKLET